MKLRALFLFFILALALPAVASAQSSTSTATSTNTKTPAKPVCTITASPGAVYLGDTATLRWASQNATGGTITSLGTVGPSGIQGVIPTNYSSTFYGTFNGPGGTGTCSVTISILQGSGGGGTGTGASPVAPVASTKVSSGSGLIPCSGTDCEACHLASLAQGIINWLVGISIPLAAAMFAWAGIIYFTSGIESDWNKKSKAHSIFKSVGIGFLIVLCAWLGVQTVLKTVLSPGFYQSWNEIKCVGDAARPKTSTIQQALSVIPFLRTDVSPTTPSLGNQNYGGIVNLETGCAQGDYFSDGSCLNAFGGNYSPVSTTNCDFELGCFSGAGGDNSDIAAAADAYYGTDTSAGPDDGNKACAWAVNNVLKSNGIPPIDGDSVYNMEQSLQGGRGTSVDQSSAQKGDIVIFGGMSHVGICKTDGCTQVVSNSSSQASFTSVYPPTSGSRIYRVNR